MEQNVKLIAVKIVKKKKKFLLCFKKLNYTLSDSEVAWFGLTDIRF